MLYLMTIMSFQLPEEVVRTPDPGLARVRNCLTHCQVKGSGQSYNFVPWCCLFYPVNSRANIYIYEEMKCTYWYG